MRKSIFTFILLTAVFIFFFIPASAAQNEPPAVSAQAYALMDDTGSIISSRSPEKRLPVASTTKIMTALLAIELGDLGETITVKREHTLAEGSRMYLREGEVISLNDLLYGLLLSSGNDAALAVAELVSGSVGKFVIEMNKKAASLNMTDTHFVNPSGLPQDGQYSSAGDMALLMASAMQNDTFAQITGTREAVRAGRTIVNHNRLISTCPGVDGGKTGYTKQAGRCLVTTAERNGRRLYAVTLNAPDDWDDHEKLYGYGFSRYESVNVFIEGEFETALCVVGGYFETVPLYIKDGAAPYLTPGELESSQIIVCIPRFEYAPLKKDARVGYVALVCGEREIARAELYCAGGVLYKSAGSNIY